MSPQKKAALWYSQLAFVCIQDTTCLLSTDTGSEMTAVAIGIAKLGDPAVVLNASKAGGFVASGRAPSVAAGRLSYVHGLKVRALPYIHSALLHLPGDF